MDSRPCLLQVNAVAISLGAGVYFNTMVPWRDQVSPTSCYQRAESGWKWKRLLLTASITETLT